ncbi:MAG TPA: GGDEF domain-containing protein [Zeimonas sp.]
MKPGRSCGGSAHHGTSRRVASPAAAGPSPEGAGRHPVGRAARRIRGNRELALDALRNELSTLRAQLADSLVREAQARTLARTDSLTRPGNRSAFLEQLQKAVANCDLPAERLAVLFIDLDGFKAINDLHGHRVGDALLRIAGERLSASVRASDIVARLGGDEFACLVRRSGPRERMAQIAGKLFDSLSEPYQIGPLRVHVQASIGIATSPQDGTAPETLLEHADAAMYSAKRRRTGCEFFTPQHAGPATGAEAVEKAWIFGAEGCLP